MKKNFLTLMSCVVALAAYATVMEFDIDESSFIANDNTSSLTTANVTFSIGVARIEGNTSASNKRLHTNHLTLAAGKYSLSAWVKAESAAAKARVGWTNPNPSDASKTVFNYDANPTILSQGADYVEISMEFELSASTDVTLFVSNNGKTGNAILLNRLVLSSDGNSGTDPVTPPTGCTESGSCGGNLQWCYNSSTHTLTITGSGAMYDAPWYSFRSEITSVNLPNGLTSIGKYAFAGCSGLTSVTIPNSVTSIGDFAFYGCTSLTSINIPISVTSIGFGAFAGCSGLTSVRVEQGNTKYDSRDNCNAIIETATNTLIAGCQNTVIPISVTSIGSYAFLGGTGLTSINIPNSVTSIGDFAFYGCTGLTSVTIPNSVTSIGNSAFLGCTGLTSVVLGNGVKTISPSAFYGCTGLQSITCYSMRPPTVTNGSQTAQFETLPYSTIVYVPADYLNTYMMHDIWGLYDVRPIGSTTVQTTDLMVTPHYTTADVVWPTVDNAATYELVITQNGTVVCTLVFNAQGQLTSIAFRAPAESARAAGQGFQFTVTGLEDGHVYSLTLNAKDAAGNVLRTFSKDFSTGYTAIEDVNADGISLKPRKVLEEGRVIILMPDGRKFDASGRQIK